MNLFDGLPVGLMCGFVSHRGQREACYKRWSTWFRGDGNVLGIDVKVLLRTGNEIKTEENTLAMEEGLGPTFQESVC